MARIVRVEAMKVGQKPNARHADAIQSFVSHEIPILRIFNSDGAVDTGNGCTIGTGRPFDHGTDMPRPPPHSHPHGLGLRSR